MKNLILKLAAAFALASVPWLVSCGGEEGGLSSSDAAVVGVGLDQGAVTITAGATGTLTAFVYPSNAADKGVSWASSAPAVATVATGTGDGKALVTALAAGTTTITVTTRDGGRTAACQVTVDNGVVHVVGLSMDRPTMVLAPDMSEMLTVSVRPANATNRDVTWASSNAAVAAVAPSGAGGAFVVAKAAGTATITATAADGGATATCAITVAPYEIPVLGVSLNRAKLNVLLGYKGTLTASVLPSNAPTSGLVWTSSNTGVATVTASGLTASVLSVATGATTITVVSTKGGLPASCDVTVTEGKSIVTMLPSSLTAGAGHALGIKSDGGLWAWGRNDWSQLGLAVGDQNDRNRPTRVGSDSDWAFVRAGDVHTMAIKDDGSLWGWGRNNYGQIGHGGEAGWYAPPVWTPTRVGTDTDWAALSTSSEATMAIKIDGSLWGWGYNGDGRLGFNNYDYYEIYEPMRMGEDDDWAAVSMGGQHTLAVKTDGSLWSWGSNGYGQLGLGFIGWNTYPPTRVGTGDDWAIPQAGAYHSAAIKTDGSLHVWGENWNGCLGVGSLDSFSITAPERMDANTYKYASLGTYCTLAIRGDGRLYAWGRNYEGQLGVGWQDWYAYPSPLIVDSGTDWAYVVMERQYFSMALRGDGRLYTWGQGGNGQLGAGGWGDDPLPNNVDSGYRVPTL
jgi:alpha-tubulin suppressor-like RCC1 family protein